MKPHLDAVETARQRDEALAVLRTLAEATAEYMRTPPEPSATWSVIERRFRDARRAAWAVLNDDDIR